MCLWDKCEGGGVMLSLNAVSTTGQRWDLNRPSGFSLPWFSHLQNGLGK